MSIVQYQNRSIWGRVQNWFTKRQTLREMSRLPDYLLADIGVHRDQIPTMVDDLLQKQVSWSSVPAQRQAQPLSSIQHTSYR